MTHRSLTLGSSRFVRSSAAAQTLFSCLVLVGACGEDASLHSENRAPIAEAMVVNPETGMAVQAAQDGSLAPVTFPYAGVPVRITLDGRNSRDPDGEIREYRWLSGTRVPDAGVLMPPLRRVPEGQPVSWPDDGETSTVELGQGAWSFTLWVRDDARDWSGPDTIRIVIGTPPATAPRPDAGALAPTTMDGGITSPVASLDGGR